ncbi:hypothetical protein BaRGS_00010862 [Batillaria attramentaria]|uniref:Neprilysin n=1 Tax=Batillaria attramentaria TaxID=370345 RepID=A0ABD0LF51_9CAEN
MITMETMLAAEKQSWLTENGRDVVEDDVTVEYSSKSNGTVSLRSEKKGYWSHRNTKILLAVVVLCVLVAIGLIIALAVSNADSDSATSAARVAESIDFSVDPCEDFYSYACGAWMDKHVIPDDRSEINTFGVLRDEVEVILKNLFEDNRTSNGIEVLQKPMDMYTACLDLDKLEERGDQPLRKFLSDLGGWPMVNNSGWDEANFDLTQMLAKLSLFNNDPLVDQPSFGLPGRRYYLVPRNDSNLAAYETLMRNVATELGATDMTKLEQDIQDVVDFEIQLANISVPDEDRRDSEKLYNKYTLEELSTSDNFTGMVDWERLLKTLFNHEDINVPLTGDEPIINRSPPYFTRLVLDLLPRTSNRTLVNFLVWRIVLNRVNSLNAKYRGFMNDYNKVVFGTATERARFRVCASYATNNMGLAVGNMFVKEAFDEQAKDLALEMIVELKNAFNQLLDDLDWMDDTTKKVAREKNEYIDDKIGFPDEVLNITYLTTLYQNFVHSKPYQHFENVVTNIKQAARNNYKQLREPVDRDQWTSAPSTVNAFYSSLRNQIMFPAGILQPPFYSKTYPKALNYGGIGVVIGHEITHGFDDREDIVEKFKERAQCIVNQYGNFTVPEADMKLNGIQTQGENIADNGGLRQSFRAYRNWVRNSRNGVEEPLLPGLDFTNNQLFFVNFAQIWCGNMRRENAVNRILTGVHSPGRFRVIGTLQNSVDFAEAFQCKSDAKMNPENKCIVW